jgi:hypothetical protein
VSIKLLEPVFDKVFIDKNKEVLTCVAVYIAAKGVGLLHINLSVCQCLV